MRAPQDSPSILKPGQLIIKEEPLESNENSEYNRDLNSRMVAENEQENDDEIGEHDEEDDQEGEN